ncbi:MAG: hypothetical protein U1F66_00490 [bacterium]
MKIIALIWGSLSLLSLAQPVLGNEAPPPSGVAALRFSPPQPPENNPHPPQNAEERRRVDFAVQEIRSYYGSGVEIRHPHVIPWSWERFKKSRSYPMVLPPDPSDPNVIVEAQTGKFQLPPAPEPAPLPPSAMPTPQLKADEFMVHAYVRFPQDPRWHHLDVILTEDAQGQLSRRGFFTIPMPNDPGQLPPGVVC